MCSFSKSMTHSSIRWCAPGLVFAILAGILTTAGTGRALGQAQVAKLTASDAAAADFFGHSVSVSGDLAVIGAPYDDDAGTDSGSAYVYRYDGDRWVEEAKLLASDGAAEEYFGHSVSVSGNLAVIGSPLDHNAGNLCGSAYVYRYDPPSGDWIEEVELIASDIRSGDEFGWSVSVSGDLAVIGAPYTCPTDPFCMFGSAYVYRYDPPSGDWIEEAELTASDAATNDQFGWSVSVSGDVAVIGAWWDDDAGSESGSAYVYRYDPPSGDWIEEAKLTASDGEVMDVFGNSISRSADLAVIGAGWDDDAGRDSGSAYLYRYDPPSADWIEETKLTASDGAADDWFGFCVSVSGDLAVMGAFQNDDAGSDSGSAYVFRLSPIPGDLDGDGCVDYADLGILLADWGCTGGDCPADCDGDGDTDQSDMGILLAHWGEGCED